MNGTRFQNKRKKHRDDNERRSKRAIKNFDLIIPEEFKHPGKLLCIKLINFMCHSHYEIYFGEFVNFIGGKNGSGKSAILQGIQLCFGLTARQSGRGQAISDFIKNNCNHSIIMLSICNNGETAYQVSNYGRAITIKRTISKNNATSFQLLDEKGREVSKKKEDLIHILKYFDIHFGNPIVILSQDVARTFLVGSNLEKNMYTLFFKSGLFDKTSENMKTISKNIETIKNALINASNSIKDYKLKISTMQEKIELISKSKINQKKLTCYRNMLFDIKILEWKGCIEESKKEIEIYGNKYPDLQKDVERKEGEAEDLRQKTLAFDAEMKKFELAVMELTQNKVVQKNKINEISQKMVALSKEVTFLTDTLKNTEIEKEQCIQDLDKLKNKNKTVEKEKKEKSAMELEEKKKEYSKLSADVSATEEEIKEAEVEYDKYREQYYIENKKERAIERELKDYISEIEVLEDARMDPFTKFGGQAMKRLTCLIEKNKAKFKHQPIGPIGCYLSLKEEKWALAVEYSIGRYFESFIVHDRQDEELLNDIAMKSGYQMKSGVIMYDFTTESYRLGNAIENVPVLTIMKNLVILNNKTEYIHILKNVLIDYGSIERTILVENEERGWEILRGELGQRDIVKSAMLPTGRRLYIKGKSEVSVHDGKRMAARLVKDVSSQLEEKLKARNEYTLKLRLAQDEAKSVLGIMETFKQKINLLNLNLRRYGCEKLRLESEMNELNNGTLIIEQGGNVTEADMEQIIRDIKNKIKEKSKILKEKDDEIKEMHQCRQDMKDNFSKLTEMWKEKQNELSESKNKMVDATYGLNQKKKQLEFSRTKLKTFSEELMEKGRKLEELRMELVNMENNYSEDGSIEKSKEAIEEMREMMREEGKTDEEIEESMNSKMIESNIKALTDERRKYISLDNESLDELKENKIEYEKKLDKLGRALEYYKDTENKLKEDFRVRRRQFPLIFQICLKNASANFKSNMKKRGHHGILLINHDTKTLTIEVKMKGQEQSVKDMKSLSGGEKSFTTVSFLLALAEMVSSPIYCFDEFDVFMDAVHRKMIFETLLCSAYEMKSQFMFFTPQDMSALTEAKNALNKQLASKNEQLLDDDFFRVFILEPPRRRSHN